MPGPIGSGMMRQMSAVSEVDSEYDYLVKMIPHHREAIRTARILRERSDREKMQRFAEDIIAAQSREIEQMQRWLDQWYPQRSEEAEYEPMMRSLEGYSGGELDRRFLEDMIPHHMAAVMMSQRLLRFQSIEHPAVKELAKSIRSSQLEEIRRMSSWLSDWYPEAEISVP